jgi:hypothetical protein
MIAINDTRLLFDCLLTSDLPNHSTFRHCWLGSLTDVIDRSVGTTLRIDNSPTSKSRRIPDYPLDTSSISDSSGNDRDRLNFRLEFRRLGGASADVETRSGSRREISNEERSLAIFFSIEIGTTGIGDFGEVILLVPKDNNRQHHQLHWRFARFRSSSIC